MIKISRDTGIEYRTDSLTYEEALQLAADPDAWFNIDQPSWGGQPEKVAFPASSVTLIVQEASRY